MTSKGKASSFPLARIPADILNIDEKSEPTSYQD